MSEALRDASVIWRKVSGGAKVRRHYRRYDMALVLAALSLSLLGALLVWSSTRVSAATSGDPIYFLKRHLLNLLLGLILCLIASQISHRMVRAYAPVVYLLSIFGLIAVLLVGTVVNGAKSWIAVAGFTVQPAEFVKVAIIVISATLLAEKRDAENQPLNLIVLLALAVAAVPVLLVLLQPDLGTVLMILATLFAILAVSGVSRWWLIGLVSTAISLVLLVVASGVLKDYQIARFTAFLNPEADPLGVSYNVRQAEIAIGSGGMFGNGLFQGSQTAGQFVPEQRTDFIFSVAGEELGFLGSSIILILMLFITWRLVRIAARAEDLFGRLVAVGMAGWIGIQGFQNIGMNLELLPVTGVPLPFVSYGGSSMMALWLGIGVILNLDASKQRR
ncbi:MAG: rod shape-determining protein RodA [Candidatus Nanopelagicales bacterium]